MSSLNNARSVFAGKVQADVSNVNKDVRRYGNSTVPYRLAEAST